ncbi:hypothetical protein B0H16DRAFT_1722367 [Mycena metata]|uniref:Uncharacterized protein n=1 Tax=Mycena metata TaxID=1033252 RepID=A0AAD7NCJ7_9AGAR|nr:hypothetical protein B0H16DRAFT_1722367 [Mycena metata]
MTSVDELRTRMEEVASSIQLHHERYDSWSDPKATSRVSSMRFSTLLGGCHSSSHPKSSYAAARPLPWLSWVYAKSPCIESASALCDEFFRPAGTLPLTLHIRGSLNKAAADLIARSGIPHLLDTRLLEISPLGSDSSTKILSYATLPALESLSISYLDIGISNFLEFLARSSPPLNFLALHIGTRYGDCWDPSRRETLFQLLPRVTRLDLKFKGGDLTPTEFFDSFVIRPLDVLPALCDLTIRDGSPPDRSQWEKLLWIFTRGTSTPKMRSFKLMYMKYARLHKSWEIDSDIKVTLRELREAGMDIYVGLERLNLV